MRDRVQTDSPPQTEAINPAGAWAGNTRLTSAGMRSPGPDGMPSHEAAPPNHVQRASERAYLRNADPVLARLIDARPDFDPRAWLAEMPPMEPFDVLVFQVIGQQLSVVATQRILGRLRDHFGGKLPAPAELVVADPDDLGRVGMSGRKVATI